MKNLVKHIAVLATAAILLVANSFGQNYSPATLTNKSAVNVDATTHIQISPNPLYVLQGFNGSITNGYSATGSNYIVSPIAPYQLINAGTNVNFVHATNTASGYAVDVLISAGAVARTVTWPSTWNWRTNSFDTNQIVGRVSSIPANTFARYKIEAISNIVLIDGSVFRP